MLWVIIVVIIRGCVWGFATTAVIDNKGYDENWFWWGFFFGLIALLVALSKPEACPTGVLSPQLAQEAEEQRLLEADGWECSCGRVNPSYTGTCACGKSKRDVLEAQAKAQREKEAAREKEQREKKEEQELANLKRLREYKELLDSGVITQEEFEVKKKEILG